MGVVEVGAQQNHRVGVRPVGGTPDRRCALKIGEVVGGIEGRVREAQEGPERGLELLGWVYDDAHRNTRLFVEEPSAAL